MPGLGAPPKPPGLRARRNKDPIPLRVINVVSAPQPELPEAMQWPEQTLDWWRMWAESPLSAEFTSADWSFLVDTAVIHARFWSGDTKMAGELRQRVAKFGQTPEDRLRLRIQFAHAEQAEGRKSPINAGSRERRGPLTA